jgi:hypothetical protein
MRPVTPAPSAPAGIISSTVIDEHTRLTLADGRALDVPVTPNRRSAAALQANVRRLTAVEIDAERCSAVAVGTSFRRPFARAIPVSMALGLVALGVRGVAR